MYQQTALVHAWLFLKFFPTFFLRFLRGGLNNNASPSSSIMSFIYNAHSSSIFFTNFTPSLSFTISFLPSSLSLTLSPSSLLSSCVSIYISLYFICLCHVWVVTLPVSYSTWQEVSHARLAVSSILELLLTLPLPGSWM